MRTIIAGSRGITRFSRVLNAVESSGFEITEVVSGAARGVDTLGEEWAWTSNIPIKQFPAKWKEYGKTAGFIRNQEMADYADALIAVWDGKSSGTLDMINRAKENNLKVFVDIVLEKPYDENVGESESKTPDKKEN